MAGEKRYIVRLSEAEREQLTSLVRTGVAAAYRRTHAEVLLRCDQGEHGPAMADAEVADAVNVAPRTVARLRERLVTEGLDAALGRRSCPRRPPKLDGHQEARLIALACGPAPDGRAKWTMQLLADRLVELSVVESISDETVRRTLNKTRSVRTSVTTG